MSKGNGTVRSMAYTIGEFSELCGIPATTLRAWQNRYGILKPGRTAGGHRRYSDEDVLMAARILDWAKKGVPAGKIHGLVKPERAGMQEKFIAKQSSVMSALRQGNLIKVSQLIADLSEELSRDDLVNSILRPVRMRLSVKTPEMMTLRSMLDGIIIAHASSNFFYRGQNKNPTIVFGWRIADPCEIWLEALLRADKNTLMTVLPEPMATLPETGQCELKLIMVTAGIINEKDRKSLQRWYESGNCREVVIV